MDRAHGRGMVSESETFGRGFGALLSKGLVPVQIFLFFFAGKSFNNNYFLKKRLVHLAPHTYTAQVLHTKRYDGTHLGPAKLW